MSTDAQYVARVLAGDNEAFRPLVEDYKSRLVGVLMRLVGDPMVAEELAHDTFVKAFTKLSGFRGEASFGTWLIQIGINLTRDHQRHQGRVRNLGIVSLDSLRRGQTQQWEPADPRQVSNPAEDLDGRRKWQSFEAALDTLPPDFKEVITLRHLEDLGYEEIASLTGSSVGTLKVRNHRAKKLLCDRMAEMGVSLGTGSFAGPHLPPMEQEGK